MPEEKPILTDEEIASLDLDRIESALCKRSFFYFVQSFFNEFDPAKPIWQDYHKYLCERLQEHGMRLARGEAKTQDIIINQPPGTSKSSIISILFPAWLWAINPTIKIICASYSQAISYDLAAKSRDVILSDRYKKYFPWVELKSDQAGKSDYYTTKRGMRFSTSVGSSVTGKHADLIIVDDSLNIDNVYNEKERDTANQWVNNLSSRKTGNDSSLTILVGQRMHPSDTTAFLLSENVEYEHIVLPAEYNKSLQPKTLKYLYDNDDQLLDPIRLSRKNLDEKKSKLLLRGYNAQYLQAPSDDSASEIKENWFPIMPKEAWLEIKAKSNPVINFIIDSAGTANKRNDPSVILSVARLDNDHLYITNMSREWLETPKLMEHIKTWTGANGYTQRSRIYIEPMGVSGLAIFQIMQQQTGLNIIKSAEKYKQSKEERLVMISPIINAGRVILVKDKWISNFISEVCSGGTGHDDISDCLCIAVNELLTTKKGTGKYNYCFC